MIGPCPKEHVHTHGESSTCYWYGCRCAPCREYVAERQYYYRGMKRAGRPNPHAKVPAVGTRRRLQALGALGWSTNVLGPMLDISGPRLRQIVAAGYIARSTEDRVKRLYDKLWDKTPRATPSTTRIRNRARVQGWVPPLAWDDDTIDDPAATPATAMPVSVTLDEAAIVLAIEGRRPELTPAERRAVVPVLWARRWSDARVGAHIGVNERTVERIRNELNLVAFHQSEIRDAA